MEINNTITLSDAQKEACALLTLRRMIERYADKHSISFDSAFFQFTQSRVYEALFDYETGLWREGPDYLMSLYEIVLNKAN